MTEEITIHNTKLTSNIWYYMNLRMYVIITSHRKYTKNFTVLLND